MAEGMIHDKCGVFGIFGTRKASELAYFGLYSLQHRGQESAGIVSSHKGKLHLYKGMGEVSDVFSDKTVFSRLKGKIAVGHTRYSTTGASSITNIQPFVITSRDKMLAVAHNGNLTNSIPLKNKLEERGSIFQTTSDSEIILHLVARSKATTTFGKICEAVKNLQGAFCYLFCTEDSIIAVRDPWGFRPLALGKLNGHWVVASETCAFDIIGAKYVRDIEPGEVLEISENGLQTEFPQKKKKQSSCIFEYIYFSRPDSVIFGENVDKVRRRLGRLLAREHPVEADIVIGIPDSANTAALGFSEQSGIRFEIGLIRNHYVGRSFIDPEQKIRDLDVKIKFNPVKGVIEGQRVVLVDDSIVRGTTSKKLVQMVRNAGAKEVHFRVSSPPIIAPCFFGIDMPTREEFIANQKSIEEIRQYLKVESLGYLSVDGMLAMPSLPHNNFCVGCFTNKYPLGVGESGKQKNKLRLG
ncbi:MAG: amidophosphoribosyltransferase [candidate division Zixibacteria bacterium]|nr:amidophosphoribosyltransferase [candidate division Zixibacteria bacterium]